MWRRDVCTWPPEHWGSAPADWERSAAKARRGMECTIAQVRAAGWGDAYAGEAVRDVLENIEICGINVKLLNGTGSFDDPAWVERRAKEAVTRLEATTDPLLLPGYRKLVRKWREEVALSQARERARALTEAGDHAGAAAVANVFWTWINRPDRKAFDETG